MDHANFKPIGLARIDWRTLTPPIYFQRGQDLKTKTIGLEMQSLGLGLEHYRLDGLGR